MSQTGIGLHLATKKLIFLTNFGNNADAISVPVQISVFAVESEILVACFRMQSISRCITYDLNFLQIYHRL